MNDEQRNIVIQKMLKVLVGIYIHLRRRFEPNHNHLSQGLEKRPTPLNVRALIDKPGIYNPAIRRKVVKPNQKEIETTYPVSQNKCSDSQTHQLCEAIRNPYVQCFLNQEHDFLQILEQSVDPKQSKQLGYA
mmetsp:Transcript_29407/g.44258  ORF Transcript_29407/g.44258 Transcript_29407/m.44258 type:complete len:132 (-) Transcript_29407:479-874(-)